MKKLILSFACLLAFLLPGRAQDWTKQLLSFGFTYKVEGTVPVSGEGTARVQGNCFCVKAGLVEYWSDGKTQWVVDKEAREVYIQDAEDYSAYLQRVNFRNSGGKIVGATVALDDETDLVLDVRDLVAAAPVAASEFAFDTAALTKDYLVTDLR